MRSIQKGSSMISRYIDWVERNFGLCILILLVATLASCAGPTVISTPNSCTVLIPTEWSNGVAAPDLPADDTVGSWVVFGDSAIGKLDQANGRQRDTMSILTSCEKRDAAAVRRSTKGWLGRLFD